MAFKSEAWRLSFLLMMSSLIFASPLAQAKEDGYRFEVCQSALAPSAHDVAVLTESGITVGVVPWASIQVQLQRLIMRLQFGFDPLLHLAKPVRIRFVADSTRLQNNGASRLFFGVEVDKDLLFSAAAMETLARLELEALPSAGPFLITNFNRAEFSYPTGFISELALSLAEKSYLETTAIPHGYGLYTAQLKILNTMESRIGLSSESAVLDDLQGFKTRIVNSPMDADPGRYLQEFSAAAVQHLNNQLKGLRREKRKILLERLVKQYHLSGSQNEFDTMLLNEQELFDRVTVSAFAYVHASSLLDSRVAASASFRTARAGWLICYTRLMAEIKRRFQAGPL
jgi:hypothetical protein